MSQAEFDSEIREKFEFALSDPIVSIFGSEPESILERVIQPTAVEQGLEIVQIPIDWQEAQKSFHSSKFWSQLKSIIDPNQLVVLTHHGKLPDLKQQVTFMHLLRVLPRQQTSHLAPVVVSPQQIQYGPDERFRVYNIDVTRTDE